MKIHEVEITDIVILPNRQRREFDADALLELASSITENGLIHPVVIRADEDGQMVLVAGERRLKAIEYAWEFGDNQEESSEGINCGDHFFPRPLVPCIFLGEMDPIDAKEIELEENVRRTDLTWQETSAARAELMSLRQAQATRDGTPSPSLTDIVKEVSDAKDPSSVLSQVKQDIILSRHLDNPEIASAPSREKAYKALKRIEERQRNAALGAALSSTTLSSMHQLFKGDCTQILPTMREGEFDVILTDPPYGIGADEFGDSGGRAAGAHFYDDSHETWVKLVSCLAYEGFRVTKTLAHAYVFCDIDRFLDLREIFTAAGWKVFRTPLIWVNPGAMRAPWPEQGPQRKYQLILYAVKGNKPVMKLYGDVIVCPTDPNLGYAAQKPVGLLVDLLKRSCRPNDSVLDAFAGSGSIYPACHEFKCKATGIELDDGACGIASKRMEELK